MGAYEVFHCAPVRPQHDGCRVIWRLALGLRVHALEGELIPHQLHELVDIPAVLGADGNSVRNAVQKIELLDADRVDLVQTVHHRDVTVW